MNIWKWSSIILLLFCWSCINEPSSETTVEIASEPAQIMPLSFDSAQQVKFDRFFGRYYSSGVFNGNILIYHDGKVFKRSYGVADYQTKSPLSDSSLFQLASVSKPITAVGIMKLVENGSLSLSDSVQHLLPGFPYPGITVEMLLSHRSGLSNYMYITDSLWLDQSMPLPTHQMVDTFFVHAPQRYYPPDYKYNYSNTNYFLLAAIIESVSGQYFAKWMKEQVFMPAGMQSARVYSGMQMDTLPHIARGSENKKWHIADYYLNGVTGDKGTYATTNDLLSLHLALNGEDLLSSDTKVDMFSPRSPYKRAKSYALGWRILPANEQHPLVQYHFGWWRGYRSYFIRIPSEDRCLIGLCNLSRGEFLPRADLIALLMDA